MPITVTHRDLLESAAAMRELSDMPIPVRTALKLRKIYRSAATTLEAIDDTIKALVKKHAKLDADGKMVHPVDENGDQDENRFEIADVKAFNDDRNAVLDDTVEIPFEKIKVTDLYDEKDKIKLKTSLVFALDWLLED